VSNLKKQNIQESFFLDTVLDVIYSQKLKDIIIYKGNNSLAYKNIIISTANSNTQMNGVVKKITDILKDKSSLNVEGKDSSWLLVEVKDVLIHIFKNDSREFYNLEDIYFDCELIYQSPQLHIIL
jgi:ribosome-associated protein